MTESKTHVSVNCDTNVELTLFSANDYQNGIDDSTEKYYLRLKAKKDTLIGRIKRLTEIIKLHENRLTIYMYNNNNQEFEQIRKYIIKLRHEVIKIVNGNLGILPIETIIIC